MKISALTAKEIVSQLSGIIGQYINIMDTEGIIIASSSPDREGTVHWGARRIIREQLPELIIEDDSQYEGSRNGVNLPIMFQGELVGIIGITGRVEDVLKYGQIIKQMTEILLLDRRVKEQEVIEQKARERFLEEWVICSYEEKNDKEFARIAAAMSIDTGKPAHIAVMAVKSDDELSDDVQTDISKYIRSVMREFHGSNVFRTATKVVCIIYSEDTDEIDRVLRQLVTDIKGLFGYELFAGVDSEAGTLHLQCNYEDAERALEVSVRKRTSITHFDALSIDFILSNISKQSAERFIVKLFGDTPPEVLRESMRFINAYFDANGSLSQISENTFVHKNTVKYRINKLKELTGLDIRTSYGTYVFMLALKLYDGIK